MHKTRANLPLAVALAAVLATPAAFGQTRTGIACGNIVPAEFTKSQETHIYTVDLHAGDALEVQAVPVGEYLDTLMIIADPVGQPIRQLDRPQKAPSLLTGALSATGTYEIQVANFAGSYSTGRAGAYSIHVSCTLADGTKIAAGSVLSSTAAAAAPQGLPNPAAVASASGARPLAPSPSPQSDGVFGDIASTTNQLVGAVDNIGRVAATIRSLKGLFPKRKGKKQQGFGATDPSAALGLSPQAFAAPTPAPAPAPVLAPAPPPPPPVAAAFPKLGLDIQLGGSVAAAGGAPFGFLFDGQAASSVGLKLSRASGNLVLGLTILGPDQQVAFQGILTQTDLVSDVTLPSTGEYVARIQKVELGPIPNPEDTAFRIEVTAH